MKAHQIGQKTPCYLDAENSPANRRIIREKRLTAWTSNEKPGGAACPLLSFRPYVESEADDGFRLQTFGPFLHFEFHSLAFVEGFVPFGLNCTVVHEDIFATLPLNEPIALAGVKPLYRSLFSTQLLTPLNGKLFALVVASRVQKKGRKGISPGSLVDVSKSSHKSNKRSSSITQIPSRASSFWARCMRGVQKRGQAQARRPDFLYRIGTVPHFFSAISRPYHLTPFLAM